MMASLNNSTSCDTGLVLGIGGFSSTAKKLTMTRDRDRDHDQNTNINNNYPTSMSNDNYEPSLTLGLSDQQTGRQASPNSTISSVSVKRERDMNGSHEDHDHEDIDTDNNVRKKLRLTKQQSAFLEDSFKQHSTLNPKQKQALARQLNLRPRQVEVWFQNRRARSKLKQTEVDCDFLKKCCEKLSEENRKLQKEVQDLKAAALKPVPFYIQPALSMCPSCEKTTDINKKQQTPFVHHFFNPFANPSSAAC